MAISSRYTRGIEIQIGGNATKLKTALDSANRSIRTTQSELDTLKNSLKLEWDATKFQRAQALAQKALSETEAKAELLRKALACLLQRHSERAVRGPAPGTELCGGVGTTGQGSTGGGQ